MTASLNRREILLTLLAIEWNNRTTSSSWIIDDKILPIKEVEEWLKDNDVDLKTSEGQMAFKLRWG